MTLNSPGESTRPDVLSQLLAALSTRPLRRAALPPVELASGFDDELARLLAEAGKKQSEAVSAALDWERAEPGGATFAASIDTDDEDAVFDALTAARARAWSRAWCAQRRALAADDAARSHAGDAKSLHKLLDERTDQLSEKMGALLEKAADKKSQRLYDEALEVGGVWRDAIALYSWCLHPDHAFQPRPPNVIPGEVEYRAWHAKGAVSGEAGVEIPIDAIDYPKPPRRRELQG